MTDPRAVAKELLDALPVIFTCSQYGSVQLCKEAEEECIDTIMHALADAERQEAERCAKDVCMYCGGRALGYLPVSGPNQAGNHVHENSKVTGDHVLCRASGIYSRLKARADKEE